MKAKVTYRHNVMTVQSIDAFISIRGGLHQNMRDVYFVRGIGEPQNFPGLIKNIDQKMGMEMQSDRLKYIRINSLPRLAAAGDAAFYSEAYDRWKQGGQINLKNISMTPEFAGVLNEAYQTVQHQYEETKKSVSESMKRNFAAKILYWLNGTMGEIFGNWSERECIKIIATNVVKDQEYLFYYFLTLLGCDVLLIENQKDADVPDSLKRLSTEIGLGAFGKTEPEAYVPYSLANRVERASEERVQISQSTNSVEAKGKQTSQNTASAVTETIQTSQNPDHRTPIKVILPERTDRRHHTEQSEKASNIIKTGQSEKVSNIKKSAQTEKTFEELALLASSIVMIAIHDEKGEVIGTGSGIMIGRGGFILTNNHVASGGRFYSVRIEDDEEIYTTDEVIKYNSVTDLAVIRIKRKLDPLPIYRGAKKLVRGQKVVAIGSPLGLFNSVSDGIISGFRRIDDVDMIQFTAPISHGSSGGAVLNMQGEVIGISTAGIDSGQNINLAVGYENILMFAGGFMK